MQNALAILQFPLAPVQPALPDSTATTQVFAASFSGELSELPGEAAPVDPILISSDQTAASVVPILPLQGVMQVAFQVAPDDGNAMGAPVAAPQAAVLGAGEKLAQAPAIGAVAESVDADFPERPSDFSADSWKADLPVGPPVQGPAAAERNLPDTPLRPEMREAAESVGIMPLESVETEAIAPQEHEPHTTRQPSSAASAHWPPIAEPATKIVEQIVQPLVDGKAPPVQEPLASDAPTTLQGLAVQPVDSTTVSPEVPPASPPLTVPPSHETGASASTAGRSEATEAADAKTPAAIATVEEGVVTENAVASAQLEDPSPEPSGRTSFWERYFTDRLEPLTARSPLSDRKLWAPADRIQAAGPLVPMLLPVQDRIATAVKPSDDMSASSNFEDGKGNEVAIVAPTPPANASPTPILRLEPTPSLTVLPWSEAISDALGTVDPALSSLPVLASASSPTVGSGAVGTVALPVQQVAMQLAGVLVQASDRVTELALAPEELGKVRLRMEPDSANPDRLTILINVERPETLDLFRRHAGELAEAIRNAGYSGAQIDFGQQGHGGGGDQERAHSSAGSDLATDEVAPIQYAPRIMAGATLDLRL